MVGGLDAAILPFACVDCGGRAKVRQSAWPATMIGTIS